MKPIVSLDDLAAYLATLSRSQVDLWIAHMGGKHEPSHDVDDIKDREEEVNGDYR